MIKSALKAGTFRIAPGFALAAFSVWSRRSIERQVAALGLDRLARRIADRHGPFVLSGPFAGMRFDVDALPVHTAPKLLGTYESELHGAIESAIAGAPDRVLNVGCEAGYYAVGLALRLPGASVHAFDADPKARRATARNAELNGVADRVRVSGRTDPVDLEATLAGAARPLVVVDVEGGEATLLVPEAVPSLARAEILVEAHPHAVPGIEALLPERFARTHAAERIGQAAMAAKLASAPAALEADGLSLAVDEHRGPRTLWLLLRPNGVPERRPEPRAAAGVESPSPPTGRVAVKPGRLHRTGGRPLTKLALAGVALTALLAPDAGRAAPAAADPEPPPAAAAPPTAPADGGPFGGGFGTETRGGLGGKVVRVTNLDDSGEGSLRECVEEVTGPRVCVFEVGGAIRLRSQISVVEPYLTIAGETAPSPGISLYHQAIRPKTHDVVLRHIRVRPGSFDHDGRPHGPDVADNLDGVCVQGRDDGSDTTYNVVIDNVSVSWASDENICTYYDNVHDVTVRDTISAEALVKSRHPKVDRQGHHSMCLLVGHRQRRVAAVANLLASCVRRNPAVGAGTEDFIFANNVVDNFGQVAMHSLGGGTTGSVVGNVIRPGPDTNDGTKAVWDSTDAGDRIHMRDNLWPEAPYRNGDGDPVAMAPVANDRTAPLAAPPAWPGNLAAIPPAEVFEAVLANAGARPADRDPVDERIVRQTRAGRSRHIDNENEVGGYPDLPATRRALDVPADPHGDADGDGVSNLEEWLNAHRRAVGERF